MAMRGRLKVYLAIKRVMFELEDLSDPAADALRDGRPSQGVTEDAGPEAPVESKTGREG